MLTYFVFVGSLLGLLLGSFLNALAYRLPRKESLMTRSHCPKCGKMIHAWENIPLFSWLLLRGKCSGCKEPISIQYPLIEAFTAVVFGTFTYIAFTRFEASPFFAALALLSFAFVGILLALIDLDIRKLPTKIIAWGAVPVVVGVFGYVVSTGEWDRLITAAIFAGVYLFLYGLLWFIKPKGIGFGDVRLSPVIGFLLGFVSIGTAAVGFFAAWFLAFLFLIPGMIRGKVSGKSKIPFGPWMILGAFVAVVVGDILCSGYLQLGGL